MNEVSALDHIIPLTLGECLWQVAVSVSASLLTGIIKNNFTKATIGLMSKSNSVNIW